MRQRGWSRIWPLAIPLGLIVVLLGPQLVALRSFAPTNMLYLYWPWSWSAPDDPGIGTAGPFADNWDILIPFHVQVAERVARGDLPLWSPYVAGGGDLLPNLGSMTLAPSTVLWVLLPDWYVPGLVKGVEILGAWGFLFLFLRRAGVSRAPAVIAGLSFATTGFQVVWFSWPHTVVNMLVAGTLWAWDRVRERPGDPLRLAIAALMTAATILEGFPAVAAVGLAAVGLVLVVRVGAEWPGWRSALRSAGGVAASAALGLGICMVVLLPFAHLLPLYGLERGQAPTFPAQRVISTVLSPNSWGTADDFFGPFNYIELVGYLAPAALVLLVPGLFVALATRRHAALALTAVAIGAVLYLYSYGFEPVYSLLRDLPVMSSNAPTRAKAAGALTLACAIGIGLDALLRGGAGPRARCLAFAVTAAVVGASSILLVLVSQRAPAAQAGLVRGEVIRAIVVMAAATLLAGLLLWRREPTQRSRRIAVVMVVALVAVDAVAWIRPYWPTSRPQDFYPQTADHRVVERELGDQRLAGFWVTFWPGTNAVYGFRTMTGHQFHRPAWREVVEAAGGRMMTPTFSVFDKPDSASSPVLDRFGVSLWADQPGQRRCTTQPPASGEAVRLLPGMSVAVSPGTRRARGVGVRLAETLDAEAEVRVSADTGQQGVALIPAGAKAGSQVYLPVPEGAAGSEATAYRIQTVTGGPVVVMSHNGQPLVPCVQERDDRLRLEFVEGSQLYRRLDALPRIRWSDAAVVEPDAGGRLALLRSGALKADTVLLSTGTARAASGTGEVVSLDDTDDQLHAVTRSTDDGWLVITDPKQDDWLASVDGQPAPVVAAEHASIAVAVPRGEHTVRVWYAPQGLRSGAVVTFAALGMVLALLVSGVVARVRKRRREPVSAIRAGAADG